MNTICKIGNYAPSEHEACDILSTDGIAKTIKQNHGSVSAIEELGGANL